MTTQTQVKFPTIKEITVKTSVVDEWYGVEVRVTWAEPFDYIAFSKEKHAEETAWFKSYPNVCHVGPWPLAKALRDHVLKQVLAHPAYAAYYAKPRFATCEDGEDGPERRVQIPRFKDSDFQDWDFFGSDGWLSASDR
jgi:hypothetical protein